MSSEKEKLSNADFCRAAKRLKCGVAEIMAVSEVESRGDGFYPDGFPVILFERHKFRSFTSGQYNQSHPEISGPAGNYGKGGANQRRKFNIAFALDPEAALMSCSWGKFQIMGFNYKVCGFETVGEFVDAMKESEGRQLDAFVSFVIKNHLADDLRERDWKGFAKGYNGPSYAQNKYDAKMAAAYRKYAKLNIDCSERLGSFTIERQPVIDVASPADPVDVPEIKEDPPLQNTQTIQVDNVEKVQIDNTPAPSETPVTVSIERTSIWAKMGAGIAVITGFGINLWTVIEAKLNEMTPAQFGYVIAGVAIIALALYLYDKAQKRAHEKTLAKV